MPEQRVFKGRFFSTCRFIWRSMGILRIPFPISRFTQWDVSSSVPYTFLLLGIPTLVSIISNYQIQHVRHSSLPWPSLCRSCCCGRLSACLLAGPGGLGRATFGLTLPKHNNMCAGFLRWARCSFAGSLVLHDPTARDWHRVAGGSRLALFWRKDVTRTCFSHFPPSWTGDLLCPANSLTISSCTLRSPKSRGQLSPHTEVDLEAGSMQDNCTRARPASAVRYARRWWMLLNVDVVMTADQVDMQCRRCSR